MKSYTDLEQSKKLAKILPLESADMYYEWPNKNVHFKDDKYSGMGRSCWGLAALLDVLPNCTDIVKEEADTENEKYMCTVGVKDDIISTFGNNPVDACYEMIIKLHELNLL